MKKTCSIFHFLSQIFQLESCFRMVAVHINRSKTVKLLLCTTTVVLHRELTTNKNKPTTGVMQDCLPRAKQILSFLTFPILLLEQLPSAVDSGVVSLLALTSNFRGKWTAALTSPKLTHRRLKYPQQVRDDLLPSGGIKVSLGPVHE